MKCISVDDFCNDLRASICWNNCNSTTGCKNCDNGVSVAKIIELLENHANESNYLHDSDKFLDN